VIAFAPCLFLSAAEMLNDSPCADKYEPNARNEFEGKVLEPAARKDAQ
jgi:hypothetical protein